MPSGAAVTVYEGKRGRTFRVKYRGASGRKSRRCLSGKRRRPHPVGGRLADTLKNAREAFAGAC